jgi:hypothetical protein
MLREAEHGKLYDNPLIDLHGPQAYWPAPITNAIGRRMSGQTVFANLP